MIALLFVILFIAVPVIELWLILQVGELIGVMPTILLLLLDSLLGAWLVKSQGSAVWRNFRRTADAGRIPAKLIFGLCTDRNTIRFLIFCITTDRTKHHDTPRVN